MAGRLLVGVAQAIERNEPRRYLVDLLTGLAGMGTRAQVALLREGPVRQDLAAVAEVRLMPDLRPRSPAGAAEALLRRARPGAAGAVRELRTSGRRRWLDGPDVIHLNGPQAVPLLRLVDAPTGPVTTYVHPADLAVDELAPVDRDLLIERTTRFLAADEPTAARLVDRARVDESKVELAPAPLIFPAPVVRPPVRAEARRRLGLPPDRIVIGVPPVPDWIDGPDLTIALAWELVRRRGDAAPHLLWSGMPSEERRRWPIDFDLRRIGLTSVHLVDPAPDGLGLLDLVDLVVLPSRTTEPVDDLFVRRAAAHGTPVLCWEGDARAAEVAGWTDGVADRGAVDAMADQVLRLADDDERRRLGRLGRSATMAEIERIVPLGIEVP